MLRCIALISATLALVLSVSAQDRKKPRDGERRGPGMADMTPEQREAAILKRIDEKKQRYIEEMGDKAPNEEQLATFKELLQASEIARLTVMAQMRKLRQSGTRDREAMMEIRSKMEKVNSRLEKKMKELLGKDQFKAYKKAKSKIDPPREGRRGGGGGGGRPGGGGGGGGGF